MIVDILENKDKYIAINKGFKKAFEFIEKCSNSKIDDGKYSIDSDHIYAIVQSYQTKTEAEFESHKKYIDIQYIISGSELIEWSPLYELKESKAYNAENDIAFYENSDNFSSIFMNKGSFAIFFPEDAHKPCLNTVCENIVKKVVVKVLL